MEPTNTHLPATIQQAEVTVDQRAVHVVPALIADLGDEAAWRYVEFFTANIRNPNTRRAYLPDRVETRYPPALAISIGQRNGLLSEVSEEAIRSVKTC